MATNAERLQFVQDAIDGIMQHESVELVNQAGDQVQFTRKDLPSLIKWEKYLEGRITRANGRSIGYISK